LSCLRGDLVVSSLAVHDFFSLALIRFLVGHRCLPPTKNRGSTSPGFRLSPSRLLCGAANVNTVLESHTFSAAQNSLWVGLTSHARRSCHNPCCRVHMKSGQRLDELSK